MKAFTSLLEISGFAAISAAGFFVALPLGLAVSGVAAITLGYLLGRDR